LRGCCRCRKEGESESIRPLAGKWSYWLNTGTNLWSGGLRCVARVVPCPRRQPSEPWSRSNERCAALVVGEGERKTARQKKEKHGARCVAVRLLPRSSLVVGVAQERAGLCTAAEEWHGNALLAVQYHLAGISLHKAVRKGIAYVCSPIVQ